MAILVILVNLVNPKVTTWMWYVRFWPIDGFMEEKLMVTSTDQPTGWIYYIRYRAICLWKMEWQSFAICSKFPNKCYVVDYGARILTMSHRRWQKIFSNFQRLVGNCVVSWDIKIKMNVKIMMLIGGWFNDIIKPSSNQHHSICFGLLLISLLITILTIDRDDCDDEKRYWWLIIYQPHLQSIS